MLSQLGNWHHIIYKIYLISVILTVWSEEPPRGFLCQSSARGTEPLGFTHRERERENSLIYCKNWLTLLVGSCASMTFIGKILSWPGWNSQILSWNCCLSMAFFLLFLRRHSCVSKSFQLTESGPILGGLIMDLSHTYKNTSTPPRLMPDWVTRHCSITKSAHKANHSSQSSFRGSMSAPLYSYV